MSMPGKAWLTTRRLLGGITLLLWNLRRVVLQVRRFVAKSLRFLAKMIDADRSRLAVPELPSAWDDYLYWLNAVNPGFLPRGNIDCFDFAIKNLPPDTCIVEIGAFLGLSANAIVHLKDKHGRKNAPFFSCDPWSYPPISFFPDESNSANLSPQGDRKNVGPSSARSWLKRITHEEFRAFVRSGFVRNVQFFSQEDLPVVVEATSDEFFEKWNECQTVQNLVGSDARLGGNIGFCYIDGNHSYKNTLRDFLNCDRYLTPGGYVLFDDSSDGARWESNEVCTRVVLGRPDYKLVAKNPNYFFQKVSPIVHAK